MFSNNFMNFSDYLNCQDCRGCQIRQDRMKCSVKVFACIHLPCPQVHLPCQPAGCYEGLPGLETWKLGQKIRGVVGLEWAAEDFPVLLSRLRAAENTTVFSLVEVRPVICLPS